MPHADVPRSSARFRTVTSHSIDRAASAATAAVRNPWIDRLFRFGFVARGLVYLLPGVLALRWALGTRGAMITQTGAIGLIGRQPLGRILLLPVAVGLASYALWGVVRALLDPLRKGNSVQGVLARLGFASSGLAYAALLAAALRLLKSQTYRLDQDKDWAADLLARPSGAWLLGIVGLGWIVGAGLVQIAIGWRGTFLKDLALERMGDWERRSAAWLGRVGIVGRGVVFSIIGILLVAASLHANPRDEHGLDGALVELTRQPFGRIPLAASALGLMAFGVFSMMCAFWMRLGSHAPPASSTLYSSARGLR